MARGKSNRNPVTGKPRVPQASPAHKKARLDARRETSAKKKSYDKAWANKNAASRKKYRAELWDKYYSKGLKKGPQTKSAPKKKAAPKVDKKTAAKRVETAKKSINTTPKKKVVTSKRVEVTKTRTGMSKDPLKRKRPRIQKKTQSSKENIKERIKYATGVKPSSKKTSATSSAHELTTPKPHPSKRNPNKPGNVVQPTKYRTIKSGGGLPEGIDVDKVIRRAGKTEVYVVKPLDKVATTEVTGEALKKISAGGKGGFSGQGATAGAEKKVANIKSLDPADGLQQIKAIYKSSNFVGKNRLTKKDVQAAERRYDELVGWKGAAAMIEPGKPIPNIARQQVIVESALNQPRFIPKAKKQSLTPAQKIEQDKRDLDRRLRKAWTEINYARKNNFLLKQDNGTLIDPHTLKPYVSKKVVLRTGAKSGLPFDVTSKGTKTTSRSTTERGEIGPHKWTDKELNVFNNAKTEIARIWKEKGRNGLTEIRAIRNDRKLPTTTQDRTQAAEYRAFLYPELTTKPGKLSASTVEFRTPADLKKWIGKSKEAGKLFEGKLVVTEGSIRDRAKALALANPETTGKNLKKKVAKLEKQVLRDSQETVRELGKEKLIEEYSLNYRKPDALEKGKKQSEFAKTVAEQYGIKGAKQINEFRKEVEALNKVDVPLTGQERIDLEIRTARNVHSVERQKIIKTLNKGQYKAGSKAAEKQVNRLNEIDTTFPSLARKGSRGAADYANKFEVTLAPVKKPIVATSSNTPQAKKFRTVEVPFSGGKTIDILEYKPTLTLAKAETLKKELTRRFNAGMPLLKPRTATYEARTIKSVDKPDALLLGTWVKDPLKGKKGADRLLRKNSKGEYEVFQTVESTGRKVDPGKTLEYVRTGPKSDTVGGYDPKTLGTKEYAKQYRDMMYDLDVMAGTIKPRSAFKEGKTVSTSELRIQAGAQVRSDIKYGKAGKSTALEFGTDKHGKTIENPNAALSPGLAGTPGALDQINYKRKWNKMLADKSAKNQRVEKVIEGQVIGVDPQFAKHAILKDEVWRYRPSDLLYRKTPNGETQPFVRPGAKPLPGTSKGDRALRDFRAIAGRYTTDPRQEQYVTTLYKQTYGKEMPKWMIDEMRGSARQWNSLEYKLEVRKAGLSVRHMPKTAASPSSTQYHTDIVTGKKGQTFRRGAESDTFFTSSTILHHTGFKPVTLTEIKNKTYKDLVFFDGVYYAQKFKPSTSARKLTKGGVRKEGLLLPEKGGEIGKINSRGYATVDEFKVVEKLLEGRKMNAAEKAFYEKFIKPHRL